MFSVGRENNLEVNIFSSCVCLEGQPVFSSYLLNCLITKKILGWNELLHFFESLHFLWSKAGFWRVSPQQGKTKKGKSLTKSDLTDWHLKNEEGFVCLIRPKDSFRLTDIQLQADDWINYFLRKTLLRNISISKKIDRLSKNVLTFEVFIRK